MQADLLLDWLDWAGSECKEVERGISSGSMTVVDAIEYLAGIRLELGKQVEKLESERQPKSVQVNRLDSQQPSSPPASSAGRDFVDAPYDFAIEDDPNKRRPFRLFIVDLTDGNVIESPHKFSKRESIDLLKAWKTRKEQAVLIFWPDYAVCGLPFLRMEAGRQCVREMEAMNV